MSSYTNSYSSATTVIGYTFNADTYCRFCAVTLFDTNDVDTVGAIFNGSEWDYVPTCGACGETIDGVTVLDSDKVITWVKTTQFGERYETRINGDGYVVRLQDDGYYTIGKRCERIGTSYSGFHAAMETAGLIAGIGLVNHTWINHPYIN